MRGRTDKKFCDDYCRNTFNNRLNSGSNNLIRNVNNALRKNRRILEELMHTDDQAIKVSREKLIVQGFQFRYQTHIYTTQKGSCYHFCYEYGYLPIENNWFLIVRQREEE